MKMWRSAGDIPSSSLSFAKILSDLFTTMFGKYLPKRVKYDEH